MQLPLVKVCSAGFRHQFYPAYKNNRALPDEDLAYQLDLCRLLTAHLGISCHSSRVYEADDVLATLAGLAKSGAQADPVRVLNAQLPLLQPVKNIAQEQCSGTMLRNNECHENCGG